jgi:hypothetical protein
LPLYLADTSAWNRSRYVDDWWEELIERNEIAVCVPVRLELLSSARDPREYKALADDLKGFREFPADERVERAALSAQERLARAGQQRGPKPVDLLIAATAEIHGVTLLHYDRHFDLIADVTGQEAAWLAPRGSLP